MDTNKQITNRYGHLLDKYLDSDHVDYETRKKREEEANSRYGHLLGYAKPDTSQLELVKKMENDRYMNRIQSELEHKDEERNVQERIEKQRRKEQERIDRNSAMVDEIMARKAARIKAAEEKRMEAEKKKQMHGHIESLAQISPRAANAYINAMKQGGAL